MKTKTLFPESNLKALNILKQVQATVDPKAIIAGGFVASRWVGHYWVTDVDIFFTSPNFEHKGDCFAFDQVKAIFPSVEASDKVIYWYNKRFNRIASGYINNIKVDFIQVTGLPENMELSDYIFEKFDINLSKIYATIGGSSKDLLVIYPSKEFLNGVSKQKLVYELDLADYRYEADEQNKVTQTRLEKYAERFLDFKVVQKRTRSKKTQL